MEILTIPEQLKPYLPENVPPASFWVDYDSRADSLLVYFNGKPAPAIWDPLDEHFSIGLSEDETEVIGLMIEHFRVWLLQMLGVSPSNGAVQHS
jgi:hypothetical protein